MKRLHVHVSVADLAQSIRFYAALFATQPTVTKPDYAKWMLEDPRVNFAISTHSGRAPGVDHLGIQSRTARIAEVLPAEAAEGPVPRGGQDHLLLRPVGEELDRRPQGVSWEAFLTTGESTVYGTSAPRIGAGVEALMPAAKGGACCGPKAA